MTDHHLRILAVAARLSQRRLEQHDAGASPEAAGRGARRRDLVARAARTRAQLAASKARRRRTPGT
ncbi:hypothetical protein [Conexibacter sp. SYSU D00693]|uniref:hypothetical protein n=1 Tax=Conexibacter sp. SYSU D00693 TaxID=2812560 RepID=UPI00196BADF4|nr:hypothetical protein [Conexibacter sp. SYSU D00693]